MNIYNDGLYLKSNKNWHMEDSPYKAKLVGDVLGSLPAIKSVVEVGCGAGEIIHILSQQFPDLQFYGYDISGDAAVFWTNKASPNLSYHQGNILESDLLVDAILCLDVFEHIEDYMGFLKNLKQHGSYIIFNVPMDMCVVKLLANGLRYARENVGHLHYFNEWSAKATLLDCGYEIVEARLSPAFLKVPPRSLKQFLAAIPRVLSHFILGSSLACKLFGGYGLIVTTKVPSHQS